MDNIHYPMLSSLPDNAKIHLLHIMNDIYQGGQISDSWLKYRIIPILKPNKDPLSASSYRPIALASCVLKTLERVITNRLEWWLETRKMLPRSQFGFRKNLSTQHSIAHLMTDIQAAFSNNESVTAIFIDVSGAYDNVQMDLLAQELRILGIPESLITLLLNIYTERFLYLNINSQTFGPQVTNLGILQGGILSPLLYVIYTYDMDRSISDQSRLLQYAYDICTLLVPLFVTLKSSIPTSSHCYSGFITTAWTSHETKRSSPHSRGNTRNYQNTFQREASILDTHIQQISWAIGWIEN